MSLKANDHLNKLRNYYENLKPQFRDEHNTGILGIERYMELMNIAEEILSKDAIARIQEENLNHHIAVQKRFLQIKRKRALICT